MRREFTFIFFILFTLTAAKSQLVLNEIAATGTVTDENGEKQDWIEIYNGGLFAVNLLDYGLSDEAVNPLKWKFPAITLYPNQYLIVLASGADIYSAADHWETAVFNDDTWRYFIGNIEPPATWKNNGFDDAYWNSGPGSIGYGDGDDGTTIAATTSVYIRKTFDVADASAIESAKLHMDYDDAFVAYLNGVEIARSGNIVGTPPAHDALASPDHEAGMYAGYPAELWEISADVIDALLVNGENVLAIQVHNSSAASSDMTSNAWLSFGINSPATYFSPVPDWFVAPFVYNQTNFQISNDGETIFLSDPDGNIIDSKFSGATNLGQSVARVPDKGAWCLTTDITPETSNNSSTCFTGYEPDPVFSLESGFYSGVQVISISSPSPTSEIHFTMDGSAVTESSPIYSLPIIIDENSVIAAKCFSTGSMLPGNMRKHTYFIDEDDFDVAVLSITIDPSSLFDYDTGIYEFGCCYDAYYPYFGANFWQPWERFGNIEYFDKNGIAQWNKDMSLEIHGGWSRAEAQRSFRVDFKNEYDGSLNYSLWSDKPELGPINNFNLRNGGQHVWTYKFQDAYLARIMKNTHIDYEAYEPCALFINGAYWGWYEIREKADEHFVQSNYGIDNDDVDFLNAWTVLNGSDTGFVNLYNYANALDPESDEFNAMFSSYVDVENYVDYYIGEIYYQNVDFGGYYWGANNIKLWRNRYGGKFRFIMYDLDGAMGYFGSLPEDNYIDLTRNPYYPNAYSILFDRFLDNIEFRNYFVNRFADLINTIYMQDNMDAVISDMQDSIFNSVDRQVERWGAPDLVTINAYLSAILDYNSVRHTTARSHINNSFSLDGQKTITLEVEPAGAGYIHLNTITPTDLPWDGVYFDGVPVTMTVIANPGYTFDHWSDNDLLPGESPEPSLTINLSQSETFTAVFTGSAVMPSISVTEINYNSNSDFDAGDWIEIHNNGPIAYELSDWKLSDANPADQYIIPFGTVIEPNAYLVIANNPDKFKSIYPGVTNVIGGFIFNFDNNGDAIHLTSLNELDVISMTYSDSLFWPKGADGTGRTLELISTGADMNNPANWFDGCLLGSPGTYYTPCSDNIVFGEINYHSALASDAGDWIELWNTTENPIDISGWEFIDNNDTLVFKFSDGTILDPAERFVVVNDLTKFTSRHPATWNYTGPFLFGLDGGGEELRLIDDKGELQFTIIYDDDAPWPTEPDGGGKTLELLSNLGKMNEAENWFAGCPEGSPANPYDPGCAVAIDEINPDFDFTIYPNPSTDNFYVAIDLDDLSDISLILSDNTGKTLQEISNINSSIININTINLSPGVYWIRLISDRNVVMKKVVVL